MGPVINPESKARIEGLIATGEREGGRLLVDGRDGSVDGFADGYFLHPTVVADADPHGTLARTEVFGPVLTMLHAATLEDAIALANDRAFGNQACLFTSSGAAARAFRHQVRAGNVGINLGVAAPMAYYPFSGWGESFFGDLHAQGRHGVEFYTETKVVVERWPERPGHGGSERPVAQAVVPRPNSHVDDDEPADLDPVRAEPRGGHGLQVPRQRHPVQPPVPDAHDMGAGRMSSGEPVEERIEATAHVAEPFTPFDANLASGVGEPGIADLGVGPERLGVPPPLVHPEVELAKRRVHRERHRERVRDHDAGLDRAKEWARVHERDAETRQGVGEVACLASPGRREGVREAPVGDLAVDVRLALAVPRERDAQPAAADRSAAHASSPRDASATLPSRSRTATAANAYVQGDSGMRRTPLHPRYGTTAMRMRARRGRRPLPSPGRPRATVGSSDPAIRAPGRRPPPAAEGDPPCPRPSPTPAASSS